MNHQHWLHTRLEEAAKDPETVHNKRWMLQVWQVQLYTNVWAQWFVLNNTTLCSVWKWCTLVSRRMIKQYVLHITKFISFIQNVSISLINMQITEINRCDCVLFHWYFVKNLCYAENQKYVFTVKQWKHVIPTPCGAPPLDSVFPPDV